MCCQSIEILDTMNEHYFSSEENMLSFSTEADKTERLFCTK